jgi:hypothetical protein
MYDRVEAISHNIAQSPIIWHTEAHSDLQTVILL